MAIFKSLLAITIALIATANAAPQLEARQGQVDISDYVDMGCWTDIQDRRTLQKITSSTTTMTIESCIKFCEGNNFNLAGVEFGQECWCSNAMDNGPTLLASANCGTPCAGNSLETCGGTGTINVFRNAAIVLGV